MKKLCLCSLFCISLNLSAQQQRHPIDRQAHDALQDAVSTVEMMEAQNLAFKGWDQLMGVTMKALEAMVQPGTYDALENAQSLWVQFRDAEFELINRVYYVELQGTMWRSVAIGARTTILRQRVEALMDIYLELAAQQDELFDDLLAVWEANTAGIQPKIDIRDDLTVRYINSDKSVKLGFYYLSKSCNGKPNTDERPIISIYDFDSGDEAQCYYVELRDEGSLLLSEVNGKGIQSYSSR